MMDAHQKNPALSQVIPLLYRQCDSKSKEICELMNKFMDESGINLKVSEIEYTSVKVAQIHPPPML
jgi:hypothetical protein